MAKTNVNSGSIPGIRIVQRLVYSDWVTFSSTSDQAGNACRRRMTPASAKSAAEASSLWSDVNAYIEWGNEHNAHFVAQVVHNFSYPCLDNLYSALETRTSGKDHCQFYGSCGNGNTTYVLQYNTAPSPTRSLPASNRAFSSACRQRHSSDDSLALLHRPHPPSLQFVRPRGVPLYLSKITISAAKTQNVSVPYPVETTRLLRTRIAPTRRFMQFERCEARDASCMKYVSHPGLSRSVSSRLIFSK